MRDYLVSGILGLVEGFTEFIPVSWTAHLRPAEVALRSGLSGQFSRLQLVILQLGSIFGLLVLFALKLRRATRTAAPNPEKLPPLLGTTPAISVGWAFLSSIVSAFALTQLLDRNFGSISVIGASLLIGGTTMWGADRLAVRFNPRTAYRITAPQAVWIGACQTLSFVSSGTSRSMATIVAGEIGGLSRPVAVEFSFLLFVPTMLEATFFELR